MCEYIAHSPLVDISSANVMQKVLINSFAFIFLFSHIFGPKITLQLLSESFNAFHSELFNIRSISVLFKFVPAARQTPSVRFPFCVNSRSIRSHSIQYSNTLRSYSSSCQIECKKVAFRCSDASLCCT